MATVLGRKFEQLKTLILKADKFLYGEEEYKGPVNPTAILSYTFTLKNWSCNYLLLAENVSRKYFPQEFNHACFEDYTHGIILAYLDDSFDISYDTEKNIITGLEPHLCLNGTFEGFVSEFPEVHIWTVLYKSI